MIHHNHLPSEPCTATCHGPEAQDSWYFDVIRADGVKIDYVDMTATELNQAGERRIKHGPQCGCSAHICDPCMGVGEHKPQGDAP